MLPHLGLSPPLDWGAEALRRQLQSCLPDLCLQVLPQCPSTNTHLLERARDEGRDFRPRLLVAEEQTQGRGRLGRSWVSAAGASLTFSLALPLAPSDWSGLSLAAGLALAEALDAQTVPPAVPRIGLKWPNDLWLTDAHGGDGGRKLGGILIETVGTAHGRVCVVGVGLNVRPLPGAFADGLAIACLQELDAGANAPAALACVALPLLLALLRFEREGFAPLQQRYAARDTLRGHEVKTSLAHPAAGVAETVDAAGALVLRSGAEMHRIVSGEVSVRRLAAERPR